MELILASNNEKKLRELREILGGMGIEVLSQRQAGCLFSVEENGSTFAENARLKAQAVVDATGKAAIADDSGLCVDALDGRPGVLSARYGPDGATDTERYLLLLEEMQDKQPRTARFVSSICCVFPNGDVITAEGVCPGEILTAPRGDFGFGYDPIFCPAGRECSMAELEPEQKNAISHRGNALRQFREKLQEYCRNSEVED